MILLLSDVEEEVRGSQEFCKKTNVGQSDVLAGCSHWSEEKTVEEHGQKIRKKREYKTAVVEEDLGTLTKKKFAPESRKKMKWAYNLYQDWRMNRINMTWCAVQIINANLSELSGITKEHLCFALCRFVREIKKLNGQDYPPNTIREIVIMIQMFLHEQGLYWRLLESVDFVQLHNMVDNTMKEHHAMGLGVRKSAEIVSLDNETRLFSMGQLGEDDPSKLLRTVIYMVGLHCALRGGAEHNNLRRPGFDPQITIEKDDRGCERIVYREDPCASPPHVPKPASTCFLQKDLALESRS